MVFFIHYQIINGDIEENYEGSHINCSIACNLIKVNTYTPNQNENNVTLIDPQVYKVKKYNKNGD